MKKKPILRIVLDKLGKPLVREVKSKPETLAPIGHLSLKVYDGGQLVSRLEGKNLITTLGRDAIAKMLGGTLNKQIVEFGAGTSGAAPVLGDTSLTAPFIKALDAVAYPVSGKVVFTFEMGTAEGNGATYQEWGLFCDDGDLFSRKTSSPIVKTNTMTIQGEWSVQLP